MKQVCFLIPEGSLKASSLFGAIEIFEMANEFYSGQGSKAYYNISIAGLDLAQVLLNTQFSIKTVVNISKLERPDLIIIPGLYEQNNYSIKKNKKIIHWIIEQYKEGTELASLCTGSFLLAATGLLKGRECSTHWKAETSFIAMYPDVKLRTDKIITEGKGIYTAGGANSSFNLILHLIEKYNGREAALYCAKILQIDIDRNSQSPFMLFEGQRNHDDEEIKKIQDFIEKNFEERISIDFLAEKFSMSRRNFVRRFKKATNTPPIVYIQKVKIEVAKRNLEFSRKNVNEVMYSVGYSDTKAFRTIFKKITGLTPSEYKTRFSNT